MKFQALETSNGNLSSAQLRTFKKFKRELSEKVPDYRITWVRPYNKSIIEIGYAPQKKLTHRKMLQTARLAIEVGDETGIAIILG